jgi:hypothetical protein
MTPLTDERIDGLPAVVTMVSVLTWLRAVLAQPRRLK